MSTVQKTQRRQPQKRKEKKWKTVPKHTKPEEEKQQKEKKWKSAQKHRTAQKHTKPEEEKKAETKAVEWKWYELRMIPADWPYYSKYSKVFRVHDKRDGHVTSFFIQLEKNQYSFENVKSSLQLISKRGKCHQNIICIQDTWIDGNNRHWIKIEDMTGYASMTDCFIRNHQNNIVPINNETKIPDISRDYGQYRSDITKMLIYTLKDIHTAGIAHNAIRPDSIFIKIQNGHVIVKFANFELSCSTVECPDVKNGDPQDAPYERFVEMHKEKFTKFFRNRDDTDRLLEDMWKNYLKRADRYALFACIYFMWTGKHTKADFINLSRLPETEREALKQIAIELKLDLKYFKFNRWYQRWYQRWFQ